MPYCVPNPELWKLASCRYVCTGADWMWACSCDGCKLTLAGTLFTAFISAAVFVAAIYVTQVIKRRIGGNRK